MKILYKVGVVRVSLEVLEVIPVAEQEEVGRVWEVEGKQSFPQCGVPQL